MSTRHKVFVSYHHALDEEYKEEFERLFGEVFDVIVPGSVQVGDIDPNLPTDTIRQKIRDEYLRDTSVTVVLIGENTWQRKHVDWEIGSSIRHTKSNSRSGLLGIILPTYPRPARSLDTPYTIPPRLHDNIECGFASIHPWSDDAATVQGWIHAAYERRNRVNPDNSRDSFGRNRTGAAWTD